MAENAARVVWAGAGVSLPRRLVTARGVRLRPGRCRATGGMPAAPKLADWGARMQGPLRQLMRWRNSGGSQ